MAGRERGCYIFVVLKLHILVGHILVEHILVEHMLVEPPGLQSVLCRELY
jgi:hypothetical protein